MTPEHLGPDADEHDVAGSSVVTAQEIVARVGAY